MTGGAPSLARRERRALCEDALLLGSDAPTLCGGWTAQDLVVHLLVRERHPLSAAGIFLPAVAVLTARTARRLSSRDFPVLVARLREPGLAPLAMPVVESLVSTAELFVHHEDLRRAQERWTPRALSPQDQDTLWRLAGLFGRVLARPAGVPVRLERPDRPGRGVTLVRGTDPAVVTGLPSELVLYLFGRAQVDDVGLTGPEHRVAALRAADLGL